MVLKKKFLAVILITTMMFMLVQVYAETEIEGNGTVASPCLVTNEEQLLLVTSDSGVSNPLSSYIKLQNDITLSSTSWTPFGDNSTPFSGNFDGGGHTISNITVISAVASGTYVGFF